MNKETAEVIDKIIDILKEESEDFIKQFPESVPSLQITTYNPSELTDLEKEFKIRIPKLYKEFLEKYSPKRFHIMFTDIYGIMGLRKMLKDYIPDEILEEKFIPFAGDDGNYYCLNMETDEDRVFFFDHEELQFSKTRFTFKDFFQDLLNSKLELNEENNSK